MLNYLILEFQFLIRFFIFFTLNLNINYNLTGFLQKNKVDFLHF